MAGFVAVNEIMGVQHKLLLNFTAGYGFTGIAVALMGRNHPVGIIMASLLFGVLYQGGAELAFEIPLITREMVVTIQGLIILFSGCPGTDAAPVGGAPLSAAAAGAAGSAGMTACPYRPSGVSGIERYARAVVVPGYRGAP